MLGTMGWAMPRELFSLEPSAFPPLPLQIRNAVTNVGLRVDRHFRQFAAIRTGISGPEFYLPMFLVHITAHYRTLMHITAHQVHITAHQLHITLDPCSRLRRRGRTERRGRWGAFGGRGAVTRLQPLETLMILEVLAVTLPVTARYRRYIFVESKV